MLVAEKETYEKEKVLSLYLIFFGSVFLAFLPYPAVSFLSIIVCICTLSVIYALRSRAEEDSFLESHTNFIIRTFWRMNLILLYSLGASALYFSLFADYLALAPCIKYIDGHSTFILRHASVPLLSKIFVVCKESFMKENFVHFLITAFIAFSPTVLYLLTRYLKGWVLASRGKSIL